MNKKCILTICLAMMGILGMKAQSSGLVALHHEGNVTLYAGPKIQDAINASVQGDTLYLSDGSFPGFTVTHGMVIQGIGATTTVLGDVAVGHDSIARVNNCTLNGLNMLQNFYVNSSVDGLNIIQCQMLDFEFKGGNGKTMDVINIYMSAIYGTLKMGWNIVKNLEAYNSKIQTIFGGAPAYGAVFRNCNISKVEHSGYTAYATFINCMVDKMGSSGAMHTKCVNSLIKENNPASSIVSDCYEWEGEGYILDEKQNCTLSDAELKEKGYLGTDGTVVGITGGVHPFTLEVFSPHVVEHTIDVDNVNATLKVTLKMAGDVNQ